MKQIAVETDLIRLAREARQQAYCPYSRFAVGAALLAEDGNVYTGCNIENISYGLTICAERNALAAAVSAGQRKFKTMLICADSNEPVTPCGACRQVLSEFCEELEVISTSLNNKQYRAMLSALLPRAKEGILDHTNTSNSV